MATTIKDIVERTGLSLGTVSKYLNGVSVKPKNKVLIDEAVEFLDFKVNLFARGLRTKESKSIGIIIPSLELTFSTKIVAITEKYLAQNGYVVMICVVTGDEEIDSEKLQNLVNQSVDGLLVIPPAKNRFLTTWLEKMNGFIPVIVLDRYLESNVVFDHVVVDNRQAAKKAVTRLLLKGHTRIGIIAGDKGGYTSKERLLGYQDALNSQGVSLKPEYIVYGDFSKKSGYDACQELFELQNVPTAIFVTNYDMTVGALECFNSYQKRIGEDISLIGFDSTEISTILTPKLSMVIQPVDKMAEFVAEELLKAIREPENVKSKSTVFTCELLIEDSIQSIK